MRWKESLNPYEHWLPWFAWYPVLCEDGTWVWLEKIERKKHLGYVIVYWLHRLPKPTNEV